MLLLMLSLYASLYGALLRYDCNYKCLRLLVNLRLFGNIFSLYIFFNMFYD